MDKSNFHTISIAALNKLYDYSKISDENTVVKMYNVSFFRNNIKTETGIERHYAHFIDSYIPFSHIDRDSLDHIEEELNQLASFEYMNQPDIFNFGDDINKENEYIEEVKDYVKDYEDEYMIHYRTDKIHQKSAIFYDNDCNMKIFDHNYNDDHMELESGYLLDPAPNTTEYNVTNFAFYTSKIAKDETPLCKAEFTIIFDTSHKYQMFKIYSKAVDIPIYFFHDLDTNKWVDTSKIYAVKYEPEEE